MTDSVYRVTEVIGVSTDSWEAAARSAVETAARTVRDLRVAEATRFDVTIQDGKVANPVDVIVRDHVAAMELLKDAMS